MSMNSQFLNKLNYRFEMEFLIMGFIIAGLSFIMSSNANGQESQSQQEDLVFEVQGLKSSVTNKEFQINGEVWEKICPSNECQMVKDEYSSYTVTPEADDTAPSLYVTLYFYVHDNITNKDLTPLQKKFAERYQLSFSCNVNSVKDIIEKGDNVVYKCSGDYTTLSKYNKEENDPTYFYKVQGTYDTNADTLIASGEYDSQYPS